MPSILSTKEKALSINLNPRIYGTIAEIGGGQETARHLFQAGGSSNTIAKSVSAYDKNFSNHFYTRLGKQEATRYVSRERLLCMLDKEYDELSRVLTDKQKKNQLFVFANTVETINFHKTNQGHGWLGVCFHGKSLHTSNYIYIHVRLHEKDTLLQQYTLGTLGINLLYACFLRETNPNIFLCTLMENLDPSRVEIDFAHMEGPELSFVNNRLLNVQLVKNGITQAMMFNAQGEVLPAADILYKKNILAFRGEFRPINRLGMEIIKQSFLKFSKDPDYTPESTFSLCEITLNSLLNHGDFDEQDFLDRVDILNAIGQNVMISNCKEFYELSEYFSRFNTGKIRIVMGIPTFTKLLDKSYYTLLKGQILEAMGRLFTTSTKIYLYPQLTNKGQLISSQDLNFDQDISKLFQFLCMNQRIVDINIENIQNDLFQIDTDEVRKLIQAGDSKWECWVDPLVANIIKERRLFM